MLAEYDGADALQRQYVFAPGMDQPVVWCEGATIDSATRRFLSSDERGSIVSVTDSSGALLNYQSVRDRMHVRRLSARWVIAADAEFEVADQWVGSAAPA